MCSRIIYKKTARRMPVRLGLSQWQGDVQGQIPPGWCLRCGAEVYTPGEALCERCLERREPDEFSQSLSHLHTGEESGKL